MSANTKPVDLHEPPHSEELERSILSILLTGDSPVHMQMVREHVHSPLIFYMQRHQVVYLACLDLDDRSEAINATSVGSWLQQISGNVVIDRLKKMQHQANRKRFDLRPEHQPSSRDDSAIALIGDWSVLTDLAMSYAPSSGIEELARQLFGYHLKRQLIAKLSDITNEARRTVRPVSELVDAASSALIQVSDILQAKTQSDNATSIDQILLRSKSPEDAPALIGSGFGSIDEVLGSFHPGGLYVLAARPGVGKTTLAQLLAFNFAAFQNKRTLFFSLEMDKNDLLVKFLSSMSKVPARAITEGTLTTTQYSRLEMAAGPLRSTPIDIYDSSDQSCQHVRAFCKRQKLAGLLDVVIIDYLQLMQGSDPRSTEYERVSEITRTLKNMARELHIPVLALSQLSRDSEKTAGGPREPRLSDLRGSGSIEQDADAVLFLHRVTTPAENETHRYIKLIIAKNRWGQVTVNDATTPKFVFQGAISRLDEIDSIPTGEDDGEIEAYVHRPIRNEEAYFAAATSSRTATEPEPEPEDYDPVSPF